jgi:hypothetical protein
LPKTKKPHFKSGVLVFGTSVEAYGGVRFVVVEVKVRTIVAFCIGGRGYIKKYQV